MWALARENPKAEKWLTRSSLTFTENKGQVVDTRGNLRPDILYTAEANGAMLYFRSNGVSYVFPKVEADYRTKDMSITSLYRMDLELVGANPSVRVVSEDATEERSNYYLGHCPQGIVGVNSYRKIVYKNVYDKIDLVFYTTSDDKGQALKYDFVVQPGGKVSDIRLRHAAAEQLRVARDGKLEAINSYGKVVEDAPYVYQASASSRTDVKSSFNLKDGVVTFNVDNYDATRPLVIDPVSRQYSGYWGGTGLDRGFGVSADGNGNVNVVGLTQAGSFPATVGQTNFGGISDAVVVQFNKNGGRNWSTYYGGSGIDQAFAVDTDDNNNVVFTGYTGSSNFPGTSGCNNCGGDVFVVKLGSNGAAQWSRLIGGSANDQGYAIMTDGGNNVLVTGQTFSTDFTVTPDAAQLNNRGARDAFLVEFSPSGTLSYSSYYGGRNDDQGFGIDIDAAGAVVIAGLTASDNLQGVSGSSAQSTFGGGTDMFVAKFSANNALQWATYYGGASNDQAWAATFDYDGNVVVAGETVGSGFTATSGALRTSNSGSASSKDAVVLKLTSGGSRVWATYFGGSADDDARGINVAPNNNVYITGLTGSSDIRFTNPSGNFYQGSKSDNNDAYVACISASGNSQVWGSYMGGEGNDLGRAIDVKHDNTNAYIFVTGQTSSFSFPTLNAAQTSRAGNDDIFVAQFAEALSSTNPCTLDATANGASFCQGGSGTLSASATGASGAVNFAWNTGATGASLNVSVAGTYTVTATDASGCTDVATAVASVSSIPSASISGAGTFCGQATLTASPSGASYSWSNGATTQSITVNASGNYSVNVTVAGCGSASASASVTINNGPTVSLSANGATSICPGGNVVLSANSISGASYTWKRNGDVVATTGTSYNAVSEGSYTVEASVNGCTSVSSPVIVSLNPTGSAITISPAQGDPRLTFCDDGSVTLTANTNSGTFKWRRNGVIMASVAAGTRSIIVRDAAIYDIADDGSGCSSAKVTTTVYPNPSGSVLVGAIYGPRYAPTSGVTLCEGDSVLAIGALAPNHVIEWYKGIDRIAGADKPYLIPARRILNSDYPADYNAIVVNTITGCRTVTARIRINEVNPRPAATLTTTSGSATGCAGTGVTLSANAGENIDGLSFTWTYMRTGKADSVLASNSANRSMVATMNGKYMVTVTNQFGCPRKSNIIEINLSPNPTVNITAGGAITFCDGGNVTLTANASVVGGTIASYQWYLGSISDNNILSGATTNSYTASRTGSYYVKVVSNNGCVATAGPVNVSASNNPSIAIGPTTGLGICIGKNFLVSVSRETRIPGAKYEWFINDVLQSQSGIDSYEFLFKGDALGTYRIRASVTSAGCAGNSNSLVVTVNPNTAVARIENENPIIFCEAGSVVLRANTGTDFTYQWYRRNTPISGANQSTYEVVSTADTFRVEVTNQNGCSRLSAPIVTRVNPNPKTVIGVEGPRAVCPENKFPILHAITTIDPTIDVAAANGGLAYEWRWNSLVQNETSANLQTTLVGNYSLVVTNIRTGCRYIVGDTVRVTTLSSPSSTAILADNVICTKGDSTVIEAVADAAGSMYQWVDGNGNAIAGATGMKYVVKQATAGSYTYRLRVTNAQGCVMLSAPVTVNAYENPSITYATGTKMTVCRGGYVDLTVASGYETYNWFKGTTLIASKTGVGANTYRVTEGGDYSVEIISSVGCYTHGDFVTVEVLTTDITPNIETAGPYSFCIGDSVVLRAPLPVETDYEWRLENGTVIGRGAILPFKPTTPGVYNIDVKVKDLLNGCQYTSAPIKISVFGIPQAPTIKARVSVENNTNICDGGSVILYVDGTAATNGTYEWYRVGEVAPVGFGTSYRATVEGTYRARLTVDNTGVACNSQNSNDIAITVFGLPSAAITNSGAETFCQGESTTLSAACQEGVEYTWYRNGVKYSTGCTVTVTESATFFVSARNTLTGCVNNSSSVRITVNPLPMADAKLITPAHICSSQAIELFVSTNAGAKVQWYRNDAIMIEGTSASYVPNPLGSGSYDYYAITTLNGCSSKSNVVNVMVHDYPTVSTVAEVRGTTVVTGNATLCNGESLMINTNTTNTDASVVYSWTKNGVTIDGATSSSYMATDAGMYTMTASNYGICNGSASFTIEYAPVPVASINGSDKIDSICAGQTTILTATGTPDAAYTYTWYNNGTEIAGASSYTYTASESGSYTVMVTSTIGCKSAVSGVKSVVVSPNPAPAIGIETSTGHRAIICRDGRVKFYVTNPAAEWDYTWYVNGSVATMGSTSADGSSFWIQNPPVGDHTVSVKATNRITKCFGVSSEVAVEVKAKADVTIVSADRCASDSRSATLNAEPMSSTTNTTEWSYRWYRNGVRVLGNDSKTLVTNAPGIYFVNVLNKQSGCEVNSDTFAVYVIPNVYISSTTPSICQGQSTTLSGIADMDVTYSWTSSNGWTGTGVSVTVSPSATSTYSLVVTSASGCTNWATPFVVAVNDTPRVAISVVGGVARQTICPDGKVDMMVDEANSMYIAGATYQWYKDGVAIDGATGSSFSATGLQTGKYEFTVRATNNNNCTGLSNGAWVTVYRRPIAVVTGDAETCELITKTLTAVIQNPVASNPEEYEWFATGINGGIMQSVSIDGPTYTTPSTLTPGTYYFAARVTDKETGCQYLTEQFKFVVNALPTANVVNTANPTSVDGASYCANGATFVANAAPEGDTYTYSWTSGETTQSITTSVEGTYNVTVTNNKGCTKVSDNIVVRPNPAAVVTAGGPTTFCDGGSVVLSANTGTGLTYQWYAISGSSMTAIENATSSDLTVTTTGSYGAVITNEFGCYSRTNVTDVTVNPNPVVTISNPDPICQRSILNAASSDANVTYAWSFNGAAAGTSSTLVAALSGDYSVVVTDANGCTASAGPRFVNPAFEAIAKVSNIPGQFTTFCEGGKLQIEAVDQGADALYQWFRNGVAVSAQGGYAESGLFTVRQVTTGGPDVRDMYQVRVTNRTTGCDTISNSIDVRVNPRPGFTVISGSQLLVCKGKLATMQVSLNATVTDPVSYKWYFNGAEIVGQTADNYTTDVVGNYTCKVRNEITGCDSICPVIQLIQLPVPVAQITSDGQDICLIAPANRTTRVLSSVSTVDGQVYQWYKGGVEIAGATGTTYTASSAGIYTLRVTFTSTGCYTESSPFSIIENPRPTVSIRVKPGDRNIVCQDGTTRIQVSGAARANTAYQWVRVSTAGVTDLTNNGSDPREFLISGSDLTNLGSNIFYVVTTDTRTGCVDTSNRLTIIVYPYPKAALTTPIAGKDSVPPATALTPAEGAYFVCQDQQVELNTNKAWWGTANVSALKYTYSVNNIVVGTQTKNATFFGSFVLDPTTYIHNYRVNVQDTVTGCILSSNMVRVIYVPSPIIVNTTNNTNVICPSPNDLVNLTVSFPVKTDLVAYQWIKSVGGTETVVGNSDVLNVTNSVQSEASATYYVKVRNGGSGYPWCKSSTSITLTRSTLTYATVVTNTPPTSCGGRDGSLTVLAQGGMGTITYRLTAVGGRDADGRNFTAKSNTTGIFNNLPSGTFKVRASDASCYTDSDPITITIKAATITRFQLGTAAGRDASDNSLVRVFYKPTTGATHKLRFRVTGLAGETGASVWSTYPDDFGVNPIAPAQRRALNVTEPVAGRFDVSGLNDSTTYQFQVLTLCAASGVKSEWTGKANNVTADTTTRRPNRNLRCLKPQNVYVNLTPATSGLDNATVYFNTIPGVVCYRIEYGVASNISSLADVTFTTVSPDVTFTGAMPDRYSVNINGLLTSTQYVVRVSARAANCSACSRPADAQTYYFFDTRNECPEVRTDLTIIGTDEDGDALSATNNQVTGNLYNRFYAMQDVPTISACGRLTARNSVGNFKLTIAAAPTTGNNVIYRWESRRAGTSNWDVINDINLYDPTLPTDPKKVVVLGGIGYNTMTFYPAYNPAYQQDDDTKYIDVEYRLVATVGYCDEVASTPIALRVYDRPWVEGTPFDADCQNSATGRIEFGTFPGNASVDNRFGKAAYQFALIQGSGSSTSIIRQYFTPASNNDLVFKNIKPGLYRIVVRDAYLSEDTTDNIEVKAIAGVDFTTVTPDFDNATVNWEPTTPSVDGTGRPYAFGYRLAWRPASVTDETQLSWRIIDVGNVLNFNIPNLQANTSYEVRIALICNDAPAGGTISGSISNWADRITFITNSAPAVALPCQEMPSTVIVTGQTPMSGPASFDRKWAATVSWVHPEAIPGSSTCFQVIYRTQSNGQNDTITTTPGSSSQYVLNNLIAGTTYEVYVRSLCNCDASNASADAKPFVFTTPFPRKDVSTLDRGFVVYPNPSTGIFNLMFDATTEGTGTVVIRDVTGRTVHTQKVNVTGGVNNTSIDVTNITKGVYSLEFKLGNEVRNVKVTLN